MEETNVNNLNSIPNFGHGLPEDGVVVAGMTDVPTEQTPEEVIEEPVAKTKKGAKDVVPAEDDASIKE